MNSLTPLIKEYLQHLPLYREVARTGDNWPRKLSQKKKKQTRQKNHAIFVSLFSKIHFAAVG